MEDYIAEAKDLLQNSVGDISAQSEAIVEIVTRLCQFDNELKMMKYLDSF
ncbi:MAG: hypothetical protein IPF54_21745 [Draconibacterium sp.]|nr:hypothetical protein [Draconibacterium sp.]